MDPAIRQSLDQMDHIHTDARARLRVIAEQRRNLEERRRRILMQMEEPGDMSMELHRSLQGIEAELDKVRAEENEQRTTSQGRIDAIRRDLQKWLADRRAELEDERRRAQDEADHLREQLIPEAHAYLDDLEKRQRLLESRCLTVGDQIAALGHELPDMGRFDLAD